MTHTAIEVPLGRAFVHPADGELYLITDVDECGRIWAAQASSTDMVGYGEAIEEGFILRSFDTNEPAVGYDDYARMQAKGVVAHGQS